jgi:hypothetical protein
MEHLNATTGGAFLSLTIKNGTTLIKKIVANQSWGEGRETQDGMHSVKETGLLAAKVDLRIKRLDDHATKLTKGTVQTIRIDLDQRREGDVLGKSQSGFRSSLQNLRVLRDEKTIVAAREAAETLLEEDPTLARTPRLAEAVAEMERSQESGFMEKA